MTIKATHTITEIKCYGIAVECDLLGDTVIVCDFASRIKNNDHRHIIKIDSMDEVMGVVDGIVKMRLRLYA